MEDAYEINEEIETQKYRRWLLGERPEDADMDRAKRVRYIDKTIRTATDLGELDGASQLIRWLIESDLIDSVPEGEVDDAVRRTRAIMKLLSSLTFPEADFATTVPQRFSLEGLPAGVESPTDEDTRQARVEKLIAHLRHEHDQSSRWVETMLYSANPIGVVLRNFLLSGSAHVATQGQPFPVDGMGYLEYLNRTPGKAMVEQLLRDLPLVEIGQSEDYVLEVDRPGCRLHPPEDRWRETAEQLIRCSERIIVWTGYVTEGVGQEFELIRHLQRTSDTLVLLDAVDPLAKAVIEAFTNRTLEDQERLTPDHPLLQGFPNVLPVSKEVADDPSGSSAISALVEHLETAGSMALEERCSRLSKRWLGP